VLRAEPSLPPRTWSSSDACSWRGSCPWRGSGRGLQPGPLQGQPGTARETRGLEGGQPLGVCLNLKYVGTRQSPAGSWGRDAFAGVCGFSTGFSTAREVCGRLDVVRLGKIISAPCGVAAGREKENGVSLRSCPGGFQALLCLQGTKSNKATKSEKISGIFSCEEGEAPRECETLLGEKGLRGSCPR